MSQPTPEQQIGKRIAELRGKLGWSQAKLAEHMKAHPGGRYANWRQGMIDKTERGLRPLRVNEIADIAAVLGVGPDLLLAPLLGDLDPRVLDAQIAETEAKLQEAAGEYHAAWAKLGDNQAEQAGLQVDVDQASATVAWLQATLAALTRARGRQDSSPAKEDELPSVATAIVTSSRGVLVGRRHDGKPEWTFIAGEVEPGETPEFAAVREVKEETGLEARARDEIGRRIHPRTGREMIYIAAEPVLHDDLEVFVGDEAELAEVKWVSLAEADELMAEYGMYEPVHEHLARELGEG